MDAPPEASAPLRDILVAGLGNPGPEYEDTPHNLGFMLVDHLARELGTEARQRYAWSQVGWGRLAGRRVLLAKPQTYVNLSGVAVKALLEKQDLAPRDLILVYDDMDLPWTAVRIRPRGSAAGHHGVESVIRSLGSSDFARVRLGIHPGHPVADGAAFVLARFSRAAQKEVEELLDYAARAVASMITEGVEKAMTAFNRRARGVTEET